MLIGGRLQRLDPFVDAARSKVGSFVKDAPEPAPSLGVPLEGDQEHFTQPLLAPPVEQGFSRIDSHCRIDVTQKFDKSVERGRPAC